jgi:hypothetical protein
MQLACLSATELRARRTARTHAVGHRAHDAQPRGSPTLALELLDQDHLVPLRDVLEGHVAGLGYRLEDAVLVLFVEHVREVHDALLLVVARRRHGDVIFGIGVEDPLACDTCRPGPHVLLNRDVPYDLQKRLQGRVVLGALDALRQARGHHLLGLLARLLVDHFRRRHVLREGRAGVELRNAEV